MNSCRNHYFWSINYKRSFTIGKKSLNNRLFLLFTILDICDCDKIDISAFLSSAQDLSIEVDIGVKGILIFHIFNKILAVIVGIGISKGKFDPIFFLKLILECYFRLIKNIVLNKVHLT